MADRKTEFVSVALTEPAREALRQATLEWTSPSGRRLTLSEALVSGLKIARQHGDEVVADLLAEDPPPS
jgi:hypothetical protein